MDLLKLNLGSGPKRHEGFLNIDKEKYFHPDILHDLETFPYPFENDQISEIKFHHVLEHLGQHPETFNKIMKEIFRICCNNALIEILVPHHRHEYFFADPGHVRPITRLTFELYDQEMNKIWQKEGDAFTPLGIINNVNFKVVSERLIFDKFYKETKESKMREDISKYNNIVQEIHFELKVIKNNFHHSLPNF